MKNILILWAILFFVVIAGTSSVIAGTQLYWDGEPFLYDDIRVKSMGCTHTAIADDANLLFYNPAGLAIWGRKKINIVEALHNPTKWKIQYHNIGETRLGNVEMGIGLNIINKQKRDALITLLNHSVIPSVSTNEDMFATISNLMYKIQAFKYNPLNRYFNEIDLSRKTHYTNLSPAEISNTIVPAIKQLIGFNDAYVFQSEIISHIRRNVGFGLYSKTQLRIKFDELLLPPLPKIYIQSDIVAPFSFGFYMPKTQKWAFGVTSKVFYRSKFKIESYEDFLQANIWLENNQKALKNQINAISGSGTAIANLFQNKSTGMPRAPNDIIRIGKGFGFDIGLLAYPNAAWRFGLIIRDAYSRIYWWDDGPDSLIAPDFRFGAAYIPQFRLQPFIYNPILSIDIDDIFHTQGYSFWNKWHAGCEFPFLYRLLFLRGGINQGFPTVGFGIDINLRFLSHIPVAKWLRPDAFYFPKFNIGRHDFWQGRNPVCCLLSGVLAPIMYIHFKIDIAYYAEYIGDPRNNWKVIAKNTKGKYVPINTGQQLVIRAALAFAY